MAYDPPLRVPKATLSSVNPFLQHFSEELTIYGRQSIINLLKTQGKEGPLGVAFFEHFELLRSRQLPVTYHAFDLHHHCSSTNYTKLQLLWDEIAEEEQEFGFWMGTLDQTHQTQKGVFRVNCKDNLDRTNLVQSLIGLRVLAAQVKALGLEEVGVQAWYRSRIQWADNGDGISVAYSGTPAIRGDYTRYGKSSIRGIINDGLNSMTRYYINHFLDGHNQDSLDLFCGHYLPDKTKPSPFVNTEQMQRRKKKLAARALGPLIDFRPSNIQSSVGVLWMFFYLLLITFIRLLFVSADLIVDTPVLVPIERLDEEKAKNKRD